MALHESVLLQETIEWLETARGKVIFDGTVGLAGHAAGLLETCPDMKLIGMDKDADALKEAASKLGKFGEKAMLIHGDFKDFAQALDERRVASVDGMLLDLGVSSLQLDRAERGFSFNAEGPLDMRMDVSAPLTAREIVNRWPAQKLLQILWTYGEERYARRIVKKLEEARSKRSIDTTRSLASLIIEAVPAHTRHGRLHPATRTFQALRIAVNREIEALETFLASALDRLAVDGRIVILSFHSLEDRAVKRAFRAWQAAGAGKILTKKPVTASEAETMRNPRSRSAKLRVFLKGSGGSQ